MPTSRTLRSQSFVRDAEADMQRREGKAAAALSALNTRPRRQLTPAEAQAFYDRLLEDSEHRIRNRWIPQSIMHPLHPNAGNECSHMSASETRHHALDQNHPAHCTVSGSSDMVCQMPGRVTQKCTVKWIYHAYQQLEHLSGNVTHGRRICEQGGAAPES